MGTSTINNSGDNSNGDIHEDASKEAMECWTQHQENFAWAQRLALPFTQIAASLPILNYQSQQYDKIDERIQSRSDAAIDALCNCTDRIIELMKLGTDDVPEPSIYQPVQPAGQQIETLNSNQEALFYGKRFADELNKNHRDADLLRQVVFNPKYYENRELKCVSIGSLLKGELSVGRLLNITTDSAQNDIINGKLGLSIKLTRRMIGVDKENLQSIGRQETRLEDQNIEQNVSSNSRSVNLDNYMLKPQDALIIAIQQALHIQNSCQNENNAYARKNPYIMEVAKTLLVKCQNELQVNLSKALNTNTYVPNYLGIFQSQIQDLSAGVVGGVFGQATGRGVNSGINGVLGIGAGNSNNSSTRSLFG